MRVLHQRMQVVDKWRYATEESSEREIRILSKVHHINCIQLHAVYVTAKRVYIVTELVTGGELLDAYAFTPLLTDLSS
jgi:calcium/calmodulin-dependent protein kinase I